MAQKPKRAAPMLPLLTPQQRAEVARRKQNTPAYQTIVHELPEKHGWHCSEGHGLFVLQRGNLRMEYPSGWVIVPTDSSIKLHDRPYPHDTMQFEISVLQTPPFDMKNLPPAANPLLAICKSIADSGIVRTPDDATVEELPGLRAMWIEYEKPDRDNGRPTTWRHCACYPTGRYKGPGLLGLVTFGCYTDVRDEAEAVWRHSLSTLVMGEPIADPKIGPVRH